MAAVRSAFPQAAAACSGSSQAAGLPKSARCNRKTGAAWRWSTWCREACATARPFSTSSPCPRGRTSSPARSRRRHFSRPTRRTARRCESASTTAIPWARNSTPIASRRCIWRRSAANTSATVSNPSSTRSTTNRLARRCGASAVSTPGRRSAADCGISALASTRRRWNAQPASSPAAAPKFPLRSTSPPGIRSGSPNSPWPGSTKKSM